MTMADVIKKDKSEKAKTTDTGAGKGDVYRPVVQSQYERFYLAQCEQHGHKFNGRRCRNCGFMKEIDWE